MYISFLTPREVYDRIVAIDPAYGGREEGAVRNGLKENNVVLAVARALKEKLDGEDIKEYYTRMDKIPYKEESDRIILGNGAKADMYIRIETACGEASRRSMG
ncbi:MAG: N-acetylmuramoyl-L-alanine amidase [Lachnospiraceae bacterium]